MPANMETRNYHLRFQKSGQQRECTAGIPFLEKWRKPIRMELHSRGDLDLLQEASGKPVSLLIGADLAAFVLRFGGDLLQQ